MPDQPVTKETVKRFILGSDTLSEEQSSELLKDVEASGEDPAHLAHAYSKAIRLAGGVQGGYSTKRHGTVPFTK